MRSLLVLPAAFAAGALLTGCGSGDDPPAGAAVLHYKLTDAGCDPAKATAPAGPIEFDVENEGSSSVTELEVKQGDTILGERENLTDGLSGSFALTLDGGTYTVSCPNGSESEEATLVVTGHAKAGGSNETESAAHAAGTYREYVERNTDELVEKTKPFVAAVVAGDVAKAKSLYVAARVPYERIEPVAETFGDLDPEIDARAGDVPASKWGGFHKIEQALYAGNTTAGVTPVAKQLLADVEELRERAEGLKLQPAQIADGASELLNEVSTSKITGEEERYSHTDLDDFQANVEGSKAAFDAVEPLLKQDGDESSDLIDEIEKRFAVVDRDLARYKRGNGFVTYAELTKAQIRKLAQEVDALAEALSQVASKVA